VIWAGFFSSPAFMHVVRPVFFHLLYGSGPPQTAQGAGALDDVERGTECHGYQRAVDRSRWQPHCLQLRRMTHASAIKLRTSAPTTHSWVIGRHANTASPTWTDPVVPQLTTLESRVTIAGVVRAVTLLFAPLIFCMMVWLAQIYPASDWRLAPRHDESRACQS